MSCLSRDKILNAIVSELGTEDYVLAIWLEGSDGTNRIDEYSDIDLVCYAKEGCVGDTVSRLDDVLNRLGQLDIAHEEPRRPPNNRYKVYHLQETSESLLIDVTFQSESFPVSFLCEDTTVVPKVLVDKAQVVTFHNLDESSYRSQLRSQLMQAQGVYRQRIRAIKYTKRGLFLESLIYYQKYVLQPLVEVLRILHTPIQADCFLVHATRDFPAEVVTRLEDLYGVRTVEEIAERIELVDEWFVHAVAETQKVLSQPLQQR